MKKPGYDHLLKLIIIGDSSVGKTCILLRFSEDNFPVSHMPTIGKYFLKRGGEPFVTFSYKEIRD